ncbi:MAG: hypothetical protein U0797_05900 [Gemmataceae bacterium]
MRDDPLPPDLAALERDLEGRLDAEPPAALRRRVLAALGRELADRPRRLSWRPALAAAAVLLWINLSMSVTNNASWPGDEGFEGDRVETARRIRDLVPGLPQSEVNRQALLARSSPRLVPTAPSPYRLPRRKDR